MDEGAACQLGELGVSPVNWRTLTLVPKSGHRLSAGTHARCIHSFLLSPQTCLCRTHSASVKSFKEPKMMFLVLEIGLSHPSQSWGVSKLKAQLKYLTLRPRIA